MDGTTDYAASGDQVAALMAWLDQIGTLPFDEDGKADRLYQRVEFVLAREIVAWLNEAYAR